uniref:Putative secreted protein n=1 Tax=Anopheles triannulatus TaxID=58253 RepID=A0A2M4B0S3_9DIPT
MSTIIIIIIIITAHSLHSSLHSNADQVTSIDIAGTEAPDGFSPRGHNCHGRTNLSNKFVIFSVLFRKPIGRCVALPPADSFFCDGICCCLSSLYSAFC